MMTYFIFATLLVISTILIFEQVNPVISLAFLIAAFCCAAIILFLVDLEYLGLIFIVIYVGAISVLFIFVVLMLNIKRIYIPQNNIYPTIFNYSLLFFIFTFFIYFCFIDNTFLSEIHNNVPFYTFEYQFIDENLDNLKVFGQVLYNYYAVLVLIAGFILLVAIVGAVSLTLVNNNILHSQNNERQLSRSANSITFFLSKSKKTH